jgi:hypothetical protein
MFDLGYKPQEWAEMPRRDKAIVIAGIELRAKEDERIRKEIEKNNQR